MIKVTNHCQEKQRLGLGNRLLADSRPNDRLALKACYRQHSLPSLLDSAIVP